MLLSAAGSQFFYAGKSMQVPEHHFTLEVMNVSHFSSFEHTMGLVFLTHLRPTPLSGLVGLEWH